MELQLSVIGSCDRIKWIIKLQCGPKLLQHGSWFMYHVTCLSKTEDTFLRLVNNSLSYCQIVDLQKVLFLEGYGLGNERRLMLAIEIVVTCECGWTLARYNKMSKSASLSWFICPWNKRKSEGLAFLLLLTWNPDESSIYTPSLSLHSKGYNNNNSSELSSEIFVFICLIATPILSTYQKDFNSQDVDPPKSNKHKFTSSLRKSKMVT